MNQVKKSKLDFRILVQSIAMVFALATEISADSNTTKKAARTQNNNAKTSLVDPAKNRPRNSEGTKPSNPNPSTAKPDNPPVSIPEVVKPNPSPAKPNNPPVSIPEVVKPKPAPAKPNNPPVSIPEVVKPKPAPAKPNNPPVSIPEVVKPNPTPVPLRKPIVSDKKPLPQKVATKAPIQEVPPRYTTYLDGNNQKNSRNNQSFYNQQTFREFYEHTRKYPTPLFTNQGYINNYNTYSWVDNNRYFRGYNYRNNCYITCYDRSYNRFSLIAVPVENSNYPVVIPAYPVGYSQTFDITGILNPILMLIRITQGNYAWLTIQN